METRANYLLIGAFTLAGLAAIVGFLLWFARIELDQQFDYYDINFPSVSGLSAASDVRFSGLPVGQVVDVRLAPERDGTILVRIEIDAQTPVRSDSIATIESQGVTGVSFVSIDPGNPEAPLLEQGDTVPRLEAGRSVLQSLSEDAPEILEQVLRVVREIGDLLSTDNQNRIEAILMNIEDASGDFSQALQDFSGVSETVATFAREIETFNETLGAVASDVTLVLRTADDTIASIGDLSQEARVVLQQGSGTIDRADLVLEGAQRYVTGDLVQTTRDVQTAIAELRAQVAGLGSSADMLLGALAETSTEATARLGQSEGTLEQLNATLRTLDEAAGRIDRLLESEGEALLQETRTAVAQSTRMLEALTQSTEVELPAILADVRAATTTAVELVAQVSTDLSGASGRIDGLTLQASESLAAITETFGNANGTLAALNSALGTGEQTLRVAESAFAGAERVIDEDIAPITTDLRATLGALTQAIGQVSQDLPGITADLRSAGQSAQAAFVDLNGLVTNSGADISAFTATALPLYTRLAQESRELIDNLEQLTNQIQRDPARFFLDQQSPEFRR